VARNHSQNALQADEGGAPHLRAYRCYKVKSYIREVNRRFRNVRSMKDHGRQVKWPTPPKVLRKFEEALRSIYSRY
ncbi:unnamed protein product, partial [Tetraodon nigroviridis]